MYLCIHTPTWSQTLLASSPLLRAYICVECARNLDMKPVFMVFLLYFVNAAMRELGCSEGTTAVSIIFWYSFIIICCTLWQYQATHLQWLLSMETQPVQEEIWCSTVLSQQLPVIFMKLIVNMQWRRAGASSSAVIYLYNHHPPQSFDNFTTNGYSISPNTLTSTATLRGAQFSNNNYVLECFTTSVTQVQPPRSLNAAVLIEGMNCLQLLFNYSCLFFTFRCK